MALKQKFNPLSGQFNLVSDSTAMTFKEAVASVSNLPVSGNSIGDARFVSDTGHLYIWNGTTWVDQGDVVDVSWNSLSGKPSSTPTQIDNAVSNSHAPHSDDQDLSGKVDKVSGSSLVPDSLIAEIHAPGSDDQDLSGKEDVANKSNDPSLGDSSTLYPTQYAVKTAINNAVLANPTTYYFTGYESSTPGFYLLDTTPQFGNQINDLVSLPQAIETYFPKQFATAELGVTSIPAGIWHWFIYRKVDNSAGTTLMSFEIYVRTAEGVETLLFTVDLGELNDTVTTLQQLVYAHPAFTVNTTDVLVIKAKASATKYGTTIVQYYFGGNPATCSNIFRH